MGCGPGFDPRSGITSYVDDHHDLGQLHVIDHYDHLHVLDDRFERYLDDHLLAVFDDDEFARSHHYVFHHDNDHKSGGLTPPFGPHPFTIGGRRRGWPRMGEREVPFAPRATSQPNPVRSRPRGYG